MILLNTNPQTRINDLFIRTDRIDATPVKVDITHPLIPSRWNGAVRHEANFYKNFAIDIVTETVFNYPYPYISEKTLRPINCKRMFVVVGAAHTLKLLHSKNFVTFDNIIDESYDSIEDPEERFLSLIKSITDFCSLDLSVIKQYYRDNQWRFDHNWHTIKNLLQEEIKQINQG